MPIYSNATFLISIDYIIVKLTINKNIFLLIAFSVFCFISFQLTEIKLYSIKLNELVALACLPVLLFYVRFINKYFLYLLGFFVLLLGFSFIKNLNQEFYFDLANLSFLRKPYFITISRFVELISCLVFAIIVYEAVHYLLARNLSLKTIINAILTLNYYFAWFLLLTTAFYYLNIVSFRNSAIIYDTTPYLANYTLRLRGYYVEGGPFGLMYAFLFCLSSLVNKRKYLQKSIFVLVILLAQSKAGMIAFLGYISYKIYLRFRHTQLLKYIIFLLILPVFIYLSVNIADNYLETFKNFKLELATRQNDETLIMGRTAAIIIAPKMIANNPLLGVGLGNYSLVRNDPAYLGVLPPVTGWDLPGLGGMITLLIENGFLGLFLFVFILGSIYSNYYKFSAISKDAIIIFCITCSLGVQLHFLYIWFLIGLAVAAPDAKDTSIDE